MNHFAIVPLTVNKPKFGNLTLEIRVSTEKEPSVKQNTHEVDLVVEDAVNVVKMSDIGKQVDPESAIENGVANLTKTLQSVVDVVFDNIDALAKVRRTLIDHGCALTLALRLPQLGASLCYHRLECMLCFV